MLFKLGVKTLLFIFILYINLKTDNTKNEMKWCKADKNITPKIARGITIGVKALVVVVYSLMTWL